MFQSLIVLSLDPLTIVVPLLLIATEVTQFLCPYRLASSVFVSIFQSVIILSHPPLTRMIPVLSKTTELTSSRLDKVPILVCLLKSQSLIVLSYDPLTRIVPVGLKATEFI